MNKGGLTFLIIAIALALAFTWLNTSWHTYKEILLPQSVKKIDYYLTDFTLLNTQSDGSMRYLLKAQNLTHQQTTGKSEIFDPQIQATDSDGSIISIKADSALQSDENGPITLLGDVTLDKKGTDASGNFQLETSNLVYEPLKKELSSKTKVILNTDSGRVEGVGFNSKLNEQALRIHSNVHMEFKPAQ
jgi:lipopolysaccharide export system protein LptC